MKQAVKLLFFVLAVAPSLVASSSSSSISSSVRKPLELAQVIGVPGLFQQTMEQLDYVDLRKAAPTSKAFNAMASQVQMPEGAAWIVWVNDLINKNEPADVTLKKIISACGRCPNALKA